MKKIWLLCLCLASLGLVGCFHIPDEDWLPSKDKVNTWDTQKDNEMDQALNDIMEWINMFSSHRDDENNNENNDESNGANTEESDNSNIKTENDIISSEENLSNEESIISEESIDDTENNNKDIVDDRGADQESEKNIISEE